ncbi:MAG: flagellar hook-basal body complex protein FliE [Desulfobacterales bacterium]
MQTTLQTLNPVEISPAGKTGAPPSGKTEGGFGDALKNAVDAVERLHVEADGAVEAFADGENRDIHTTMIALEKADVAFQLLNQVRNKVITAYETIMRMQV